MSTGVYRRRIRLVALDASTVVGDLEDDFHRFRVTLGHNGGRVTEVVGEALRYPWSECTGAVEPLGALAGMRLSPRSTAATEHADPRANCTHLFDLAGLAVAHAASGRDRRQYDAAVPERDERWRTRAELARDGESLLAWDVEGSTIVGPEPFAGVDLRRGFRAWAERTLDADTAEAAIVLRRACAISHGRQHEWDSYPTAIHVGEFMLGSCHTFQPGRAEVAVRMKGTIRDFTDDPQGLLALRSPES